MPKSDSDVVGSDWACDNFRVSAPRTSVPCPRRNYSVYTEPLHQKAVPCAKHLFWEYLCSFPYMLTISDTSSTPLPHPHSSLPCNYRPHWQVKTSLVATQPSASKFSRKPQFPRRCRILDIQLFGGDGRKKMLDCKYSDLNYFVIGFGVKIYSLCAGLQKVGWADFENIQFCLCVVDCLALNG